jgi:hypothetical protein
MPSRLFLALAGVLVILRLPSLVQPLGADQGLYAYVGGRILAGELPYRDAWDQKPPAIHFTYAAFRVLWRHEGVAAAADLAAALFISVSLLALTVPLAGIAAARSAALLFLFLSDPGFQRLAGVSVRAQCETFIAAAITAAVLLIVRRGERHTTPIIAGGLLGVAFAFKYNAIVYAAPLLYTLWAMDRLDWRSVIRLAAGAAVIPLLLLLVFAIGGALPELYHATIGYNLQYSGETYATPLHFVGYLLWFPVQHARVDALWLLGGAGCAVLLFVRSGKALIAPMWVAAACLTIAINGSRGLPQYFVQALPALALAAACGGAAVWSSRRAVNVAALALLAFAVWRVNEFSNLAANLRHDTRYVLGETTREEHLARYGDAGERKYSALGMAQLASFVRERTTPRDYVYVFGFSGGAYVDAERVSSSRFFWSRPVIVDFNAADPSYGVNGLATDLAARPPAIVALQVRDWAPDVANSAEFFLSTPALAGWLHSNYEHAAGPVGYDVWTRRTAVR